jgi:hypothetical protein
MENLEPKQTGTKFEEINKIGAFNSDFMKPKLVAILLIVNLVIGLVSLAGIGYLSFKDVNRNQMIRNGNFPNGGMMNPPNGDMFNQQQPSSSN